MKIYYLNTYDPEARFNLTGKEAKNFFNELQQGMEKLGYEVERVSSLHTEHYYPNKEDFEEAIQDATNIMDILLN